MSDAREAAPAVRYVVRGGGTPSAEEVAALTVALAPVRVADAGDERSGAGGLPAWTRAALHEGVGGAPVTSAPDLATLRERSSPPAAAR